MKKVYIIGIGMGSPDGITIEGRNKIEESRLLIGAKRMLDSFANKEQEKYDAISSDKIFNKIETVPDGTVISVLMSGDIGFYSGAKKLRELFEEKYGNFFGDQNLIVNYIPGISSFVYFLSKIGRAWEDVKPVSLHGREGTPVFFVQTNNKVFFLTDSQDNTVRKICQKLVIGGFGDAKIFVGEKLSYPDEKISEGYVRDFENQDFEPLSVIYVEREEPVRTGLIHNKTTLGIDDDLFERAKVPMTKEEVRTIAVSKLNIKDTDCVYDVGAGTGSVSIELAMACKRGEVYAIEINEEAVALIGQNKEKFKASNLHIISGEAPQAMQGLPVPDKAFIGGSKGNLKDIIESLLDKNPDIRIVATAVSLEAIAELTTLMKYFQFQDTQVVQMSVSKSKKLGSYNLMMGQNPVFLVSMQYAVRGREENVEK